MKTSRAIGVGFLLLAALNSLFWVGYLCGQRTAPLPADSSPRAGHRVYLTEPPSSAPPPGDLQIISAVFGSGSKFVDVTERVQDVVRQPSAEFIARVEWLKADPTPGWNKALVIIYEFKGQRLTFVAGAGGKVSLSRLKERLPQTGTPALVPSPAPVGE